MSTEMTIAEAMRHRKRVASRIHRVSRDIQTQNSYLDGNLPEVDVQSFMKVRDALQTHLIDLRVAIDEASEPIKFHLFSLAEMKSQMEFLSEIDTKDGKQHTGGWRGSIRSGGVETGLIQYKATIRKSGVDAIIIALESKMDSMQLVLDKHNAKTKIKITVPECFDHPQKKPSDWVA